jgi:hypothetical protein
VSTVYVCDALAHSIHVLDTQGRWIESFGEQGSAPGRFDHPSDATLVMPMFEGEDTAEYADGALVAVADRMNHRVQIFEPAGQFVAALGRPEVTAVAAANHHVDVLTTLVRDGWPFFRVTPNPVITEPVRLRWRAPLLEVTEASGTRHQLDLAYAMLPRFEDWLASATLHALIAAQHHLRFCVRQTAGIALPLLQIETALGAAWLTAGDTEATARLWSLPWPAGIEADRLRAEAASRDRLATAAAFTLRSAHRLLRVRAALRAALPGAMAITSTRKPRHLPPTDRKAVGE